MPVRLHFGAGCTEALLPWLAGRPAVVLAFAQAESLGARERLQALLGPQLQAWLPAPDGLATLDAARALAHVLWPLLEKDYALVALGGGSVMDLAKWLRHRPEGGFDALLQALQTQQQVPAGAPRHPLALLPSTAGTGSEVSRSATLWDARQRRKLSLDDAWADLALVDPDWCFSLPSNITLDAGLDALAHALEALWNRAAQPSTDALAMAAARSLLDTLPRLLAQPQDRMLREQVSAAALQAGLAMGQTRTAIAHALSYDMTLNLGLAHGRACAYWLPRAWRAAQHRDAALDARLHALLPAGAAALAAWLERLGVASAVIEPGSDDGAWQTALQSERGRNFVGSSV